MKYEYAFNSLIICCLIISYADKPSEKIIWDLEGVKYGDFVHPNCISQMIDRLCIPIEFRSNESSKKYTTINYLINQGFSFDTTDKSWFKGDKKIWEDSCTNNGLNLYIYKSSERNSNDIIFRKDEL